MKESVKLILFAVLTTLIAISGYYFVAHSSEDQYNDDLIVENYNVELSSDGILTETYDYHVGTSGEYTMLYRLWHADVTYFNHSINMPHIEVMDINCPYIPYVKDYDGTARSPMYNQHNQHINVIQNKAYANEVGCYNPDVTTHVLENNDVSLLSFICQWIE